MGDQARRALLVAAAAAPMLAVADAAGAATSPETERSLGKAMRRLAEWQTAVSGRTIAVTLTDERWTVVLFPATTEPPPDDEVVTTPGAMLHKAANRALVGQGRPS